LGSNSSLLPRPGDIGSMFLTACAERRSATN
jgi:hypothetical protein